MKKFEIRTDHFEFRMGFRRDRIPCMSADEILDTHLSCDERITSNSIDPTIEASFDTLEAARAEFDRNYAHYGFTSLDRVSTGYILSGSLAWIEENEYDETGDFDQGGTTYDVSAQPYEAEPEEEDD